MAMRWAYLNGEWIDDRQLAIPVGDPGFSMGITATERLRTFGGVPFRQAEHLRRLRRSCDIIGMDADRIVGEIEPAIEEFLSRHTDQWRDGDDWAIVAFATPGIGGKPTVCVHGFPLSFADWADSFTQGVPVYVSDHHQVPPNCWPAELKCRSRMHYYLADQQARRREAGARALLLDQEGYIGEASTANVVVYRDGEGIVSPQISKVLPGVSVAVVRELAEQLAIPFIERDLSVEEFRTANEAWLSSTSICLLPIVRCEGEPIADGKPGPVYQRVLTAWNELVGINIAEQARQFAS